MIGLGNPICITTLYRATLVASQMHVPMQSTRISDKFLDSNPEPNYMSDWLQSGGSRIYYTDL